MCPSAMGIDEARIETAHETRTEPPRATVRRVAEDNGLTVEQVLELLGTCPDEAGPAAQPERTGATSA